MVNIHKSYAIPLLVLASALAADEAYAQKPERISCAGAFGKDSSHAKLIATFGKKNVVVEQVEGPEGNRFDVTVIFARDPAARLEFLWDDEKRRRRPIWIAIKHRSKWAAPNGFRIGTTIAEVEKANARPFAITGFGWEYGGRTFGWKGGQLERAQPGGCLVDVEFEPGKQAPAWASEKVVGDTDEGFMSSDPAVKAIAPTVRAIYVYYDR